MFHWIAQYASGAKLAVRAPSDPFEDFDVVPEFFHAADKAWKADTGLADEIRMGADFYEASAQDVDAIVDGY